MAHLEFDHEQKSAVLQAYALSPDGCGIAAFNDYTVYIQGLLPGEQALVAVGAPFVPGSKRCPGTVLKLLKPSASREVPLCPHVNHCGGCSLQLLKYAAGLEYKQQVLKHALSDAKIKFMPEPMQSSPVLKPCRMKSVRAFARNDQGKIYSGLYAARSHQVIEIGACPLEPAWFAAAADQVCKLADSLRFEVYAEESRQGNLRWMMLREGKAQERMLVLIGAQPLSSEIKVKLRELAESLALAHISFCLNNQPGNKIIAGPCELIYGQPCIDVNFLGLDYAIAPESFAQVNYGTVSLLYEKAVNWCAYDPDACALDLCCGAGTMSLLLARKCRQVIGIEIVEAAVNAAKANAKRNGINNADFYAGDMRKLLPQILKQNHISAIIADPARAGLGPDCVKALNKIKGPCRMALIFCALTALKRDLPALLAGGWQIEQIQGFDMFPYTLHVETVCLMSRM